MSDEFDKEAEREKLREKLADDDEKREHTQRMSELLLKGATMTNRHCDDCGDPIFRQDGQEFCPTCHTVDAADVQGETGAATRPADGRADRPNAEPIDPRAEGANSESPRAGPGRSTPEPPGGENGTVRSQRGNAAPGQDAPDPSRSAGVTNPTASADGPDPTETAKPPQASAGSESTASGSVSDARASLTRTLTRFARAAEATDDPRRARDHLEAARAAAETLSALDR